MANRFSLALILATAVAASPVRLETITQPPFAVQTLDKRQLPLGGSGGFSTVTAVAGGQTYTLLFPTAGVGYTFDITDSSYTFNAVNTVEGGIPIHFETSGGVVYPVPAFTVGQKETESIILPSFTFSDGSGPTGGTSIQVVGSIEPFGQNPAATGELGAGDISIAAPQVTQLYTNNVGGGLGVNGSASQTTGYAGAANAASYVIGGQSLEASDLITGTIAAQSGYTAGSLAPSGGISAGPLGASGIGGPQFSIASTATSYGVQFTGDIGSSIAIVAGYGTVADATHTTQSACATLSALGMAVGGCP